MFLCVFILIGSGGGGPGSIPEFAVVTNASVVYDHVISGLGDGTLYGTEDPRIAYDPATQLYYMFYTCYGPNTVLLCEVRFLSLFKGLFFNDN